MRYGEYRPSAALAGHVACYWVLEGPVGGGAQPVFPDGHPEIVFHFGDSFSRVTRGGGERESRALAVGQMLEPAVLLPSGAVGVFGIRMRPAGLAALLRVPAHEAANRIVALDGRLETMLSGAVASGGPWPERIRRIEAGLIGAGLRGVDPLVAAAAALLERTASVDEVSRAVGLSPRQLRRRFLEEAGVGPKTLGRILRFQRALRGIGSAPAAAIAAETGYYDQAHMIADFREFACGTPLMAADRPELTALFVR